MAGDAESSKPMTPESEMVRAFAQIGRVTQVLEIAKIEARSMYRRFEGRKLLVTANAPSNWFMGTSGSLAKTVVHGPLAGVLEHYDEEKMPYPLLGFDPDPSSDTRMGIGPEPHYFIAVNNIIYITSA